MGCAPGQWIEAIVKRHPITHREIGIESINRISFRIPTESEVKKFHDSLPEADAEPSDISW